MQRWPSLVLGALMAAHAAAGAAQEETALPRVLSVTPSPDGCITHAALSERVQRWLEREQVRTRLEVVVDGAAEPVGFSVLRDGEVVAERRFAVLPAGCNDRLDALALAITVAIEHATSPASESAGSAAGATDGGAQPAGASSATAPQPAAGSPDGTSATPQGERTSERKSIEEAQASPKAPDHGAGLGVNLFAGGAWLVEALPAPVFALAAGGGVQLTPLRLELGFLISAERSSELRPAESRLQLVGGRAHACLGWPSSGVELEGCAGVAAGAALARGDGYDDDKHAKMLWAAGLLRAALRYPAGSLLSGRIAVDGLINVVRPELQVQRPLSPGQAGPPDIAQVDTTFPLGAALSLELVMALP